MRKSFNLTSLLPGTRSHSLASVSTSLTFSQVPHSGPLLSRGARFEGRGTVQMFDWGHRQILTEHVHSCLLGMSMRGALPKGSGLYWFHHEVLPDSPLTPWPGAHQASCPPLPHGMSIESVLLSNHPNQEVGYRATKVGPQM